MQETPEMQIPSLCREDPLQKEMATHSSILAWKSCGQSSLEGYSPWGCKESYTTGHMSTLDVKQIRSLFLSILGLSVLPFIDDCPVILLCAVLSFLEKI